MAIKAHPAQARKKQVWKPKQGRKKGRPYVDLQGMPAQTTVMILTLGACNKTLKDPQVIAIEGICIIALSWDTDVLNFRVQRMDRTNRSTLFEDTQGREWTCYVLAEDKIEHQKVYLGTLSLEAYYGEWNQVAVLLNIPGYGSWYRTKDEAISSIDTMMMKIQRNESD